MRKSLVTFASIALIFATSCTPLIIDHADKQVYSLIESRQKAALGQTSDARIGKDYGDFQQSDSMYDFAPHPIDTKVTVVDKAEEMHSPQAEETEKTAPDPLKNPPDVETVEKPTDPTSEAAQPSPPTTIAAAAEIPAMGLRDSLSYAMKHSREYQDAKEDLYLAALDLTLERHLWTPQFVASVSSEFADYGQVRDFDRAMSAVSNVGVSQRLPYGGQVTAQLVNVLMRDLGVHTTSGESGNFILGADIPLFRGAGKVAYESRYQAERDLIYAVRTFEDFRREFLVRVAGQYFDLQGLKAAIRNAELSYTSRKTDWEKAETINALGQSQSIFDAPRARSSFRDAEAAVVSAKEQFASTADRFKIFIGMPVDTPFDVVSQDDDTESNELELLIPNMAETTAVELGLKYRLDLLNTRDAVDDTKRGVIVAKNNILPDLNLSGTANLDTDPEHLNSVSYNTERTTWRGMITLETNDRKAERNAYRASIIGLRRAERLFDQASDNVRADVRRAMRQIRQQDNLRRIQEMNVDENELRANAAKAQYDRGLTTNQDKVDAENDLLAARNDLAAAVARYRNAILEFRRDSGTLRVDDNGYWSIPETVSN